MGRRRFLLTLLAGALPAPMAAGAQPRGKVYRLGYLGEGTLAPASSPLRAPLSALEDALRELGYVEGRNLVLDRRFAEFEYDRLPALAAELVRLGPDAIVTGGNLNIAAVKRATTTIPVVMAYAIDPVGAELIASLSKPGGNITGMSITTGPEFIGKQLEILKETLSRLSRVAILRQPGRAGTETAAIESAARKLGMTAVFNDVRVPHDIPAAFETMSRSGAEAVLILGGGLTWTNRQEIAKLALRHRLPGIHFFREYAESGLLLSYGIDFTAQWRRAAVYVDKIFQGIKPADLPVEVPTRFDLVINGRTARALRLTIPSSLLARADVVIE